MKAKELMVGDWVLKDMNYLEEDPMYTRTDYQPYQIQDGNDIDMACETNCIGDSGIYQPIPLTQEILKENRFESCKDGYDIGIPLLYWDKYRTAICGFTHCDNIAEVFDCRYVHQLQHALRLCGIDKQIIL